MNGRLAALFAGLLVLVAPFQVAHAELSISITITGEIDELLPVIEYLRQQGAGPGGEAATEEVMRFEVHSVEEDAEAIEAPAEMAPEPAPPALGFSDAAVTPPVIEPGQTMTVSVRVTDDARTVDTVTARFTGANFEVDLHSTSGDGNWTAEVLAPAYLAAGAHSIEFSAYDLNGQQVITRSPDGTFAPLLASARVEVVRTETAPEAPAPEVAQPASPDAE